MRKILSALNVFSNYKKLKRHQDGEWALNAIANSAVKESAVKEFGQFVCDRGTVSLVVVPDGVVDIGPDYSAIRELLIGLDKIASAPFSDWGTYPFDYAEYFQKIAKDLLEEYGYYEQDISTDEPE